MVTFFKRLLWDDSAFERYARGGLLAAAAYFAVSRPEVAAICAAAGGLIGAGEKNLPAE